MIDGEGEASVRSESTSLSNFSETSTEFIALFELGGRESSTIPSAVFNLTNQNENPSGTDSASPAFSFFQHC